MTATHRPPRPGRGHGPEMPREATAQPPAWGWRIPGGGRAAHVTAAPEYQATTTQACGLYPYLAGSGTPTAGTPVGRHQLSGEITCLDPLAWLRAALIVNPGEFILGQPGTGKSTLVKRQVTGRSRPAPGSWSSAIPSPTTPSWPPTWAGR